MLVTRIQFLRLFGMAIAATRVDTGLAIAQGFRVDRAEMSHFTPHLNESFSIFPEDGSPAVRVRLAKVEAGPASPHVAQFSILFHGPLDRPIADGIHDVRHPALGSMSIFVSVSGTPGPAGRVYQAAFSRHLRT